MPTYETEKSRTPIIIAILLVALVLTFFASFHVIKGGNVGISVTTRQSFGFSEAFIDVDEITGMPWIAAKARFPLGCAVLQREGIIESDAQRRERINRKLGL